MKKCSMITTNLRLSKIVTLFPVFEEHWEPNMVITLADDRDGILNVSLLEVLCLTRKRFKDKAATAHRLLNAD